MPLDFVALADGVVRNNMGVGAIAVRVRGRIEDGAAIFAETGQRLPVREAPASDGGPWLSFDVVDWSTEPVLVHRGSGSGPGDLPHPG
jgi:hypothetical protein